MNPRRSEQLKMIALDFTFHIPITVIRTDPATQQKFLMLLESEGPST
jgi:hypothetical protein